jgi:hypothetical protein
MCCGQFQSKPSTWIVISRCGRTSPTVSRTDSLRYGGHVEAALGPDERRFVGPDLGVADVANGLEGPGVLHSAAIAGAAPEAGPSDDPGSVNAPSSMVEAKRLCGVRDAKTCNWLPSDDTAMSSATARAQPDTVSLR